MALIRRRPARAEEKPAFALEERDAWRFVPEGTVDDAADAIVPLARLEAEHEALLPRSGRTGVRLPNDRGLDPVLPFVSRLALIAIEIPKFGDGRGYSLARLLRERHGYAGELRAVGNVLRDQLQFLHRCGFDAFELDPSFGPGGRDPASALSAFDDFTVLYQAASDVRLPLWKRVPRT